MSKTIRKAKKKDHTTQMVADMTGYSYEYVRLVRNGERHNDDILATLLDYQQGHSKLVQHLKTLIPLDAKRKRRTLVNSMILVLAMLLTGCSDLIDGTHIQVDTKLLPHYHAFFAEARKRNVQIDETNIIMGFASLYPSKNVWGLTHYESIVRVEIDTDLFTSYHDTESGQRKIEYVVFHELGHALLHREHTKDTHSIMNERSASFYDYSNNLVLRERMLDELFTTKR